jgi:hypothetical protein
MDADPSPYVNELSRDLAIFDDAFVERVVAERKRGERPPTVIERARARWRSAQVVECRL